MEGYTRFNFRAGNRSRDEEPTGHSAFIESMRRGADIYDSNMNYTISHIDNILIELYNRELTPKSLFIAYSTISKLILSINNCDSNIIDLLDKLSYIIEDTSINTREEIGELIREVEIC